MLRKSSYNYHNIGYNLCYETYNLCYNPCYNFHNFKGTPKYGTEAGKCIDACIRVKCYVPERDGSIWDTVAGSAAINAGMFGSAATSLRFLQAQLPQDVSFLRTQSWCHMGQECLSTCAQLMRYATPSSRSAGPVSTVATELREEMSR